MGKSTNKSTFSPLLNEGLGLFQCEVLIKSASQVNKVEIFNQIRALVGVVVVNIIHSDYLDGQKTQMHEYSLCKIKYIVSSTPEDEIKKIRHDGMTTNRIEGLLQFVPRFKTIVRKGEYKS